MRFYQNNNINMTAKKITNNKEIDFEKSYQELEKIIDWFEDGEVNLDEGLEKFEQGLELAKQCRNRLEKVENRIKELKIKFDIND